MLLSSSNWSVETPTIAIDNYGRVHGIYRKRTLNTDPPPDIYYFRSNNVIDKGPKNYYVSSTGSDLFDGTENSPFETIQAGIGAASSGDTVFVLPGIYNTSINLKDGIALIGSGADITELTMGANSINLKDNTAISGFKINITGNNNSDHFGIKVENESVQNVIIKNNSFNFSGIHKVISAQWTASINNFEISDNTFTGIFSYGSVFA